MSKYRMYIDESGNSDIGINAGENNRFLCLTGVIFDLDYVNTEFSKEFEDFKRKYFGFNADNPVILHRKDIMNYRGKFKVLKDEEVRKNYNKELFENLSKWKFSIISVLLDKKEIVDVYGQWAKHPYHFCLEVLLEKYSIFLKYNRAIGDVMIESRDKEDDRRLSEVYRDMYKNGTAYVSGEDLRDYLSSVEIKIKPKTANIAGLQIADLLVTNIRNRILEKYKLKQGVPDSFGNQLINLIIPKIFKHNQKYWGYGLKKLP
ncbi:MAG: DUF3800 domain-containing protein [Christensenellales bacterium]